ncbi:Rv0361 family membrane protein [Micromonospora sp. NPDC003197]
MAYEWARPPRPRPRRGRRAVFGVAGLVVLICCVGAAGLGLWNFQSVQRSTGPAQAAADTFLADLAAGEHARAYDRLCPDTRQRWTREDFVRRAVSPEKISRYTIEDTSVAAEDGQLRATVTAQLIRGHDTPDRHELPIVKSDDGWRVCGDPF